MLSAVMRDKILYNVWWERHLNGNAAKDRENVNIWGKKEKQLALHKTN